MSVENALSLIEKLKSDEKFANDLFSIENLEERTAKWKADGFDCTPEDIESLNSFLSEPDIKRGRLPLIWQCKGPCHQKCSDIMV